MAQNSHGSTSLREKVDALKKAVDLRDLFLERYPTRFRRSGKWLYGSSPYRHDRHPSFAVNEDGFIDFATGEHGDEVDFLMREQNLTFLEAVEALEARAGGISLSPAPARTGETFSASPSEPPSAPWQAVMRDECARAHDALFGGTPGARAALAWLTARGLSLRTIRAAGLGFNPDWHPTPLRERETGRRVSVAPGVLIPAFADGALWGVHIRTGVDGVQPPTDPDAAPLPKYIYVRGSKTGTLYNGDALRAGVDVLVVEGEFDALLAGQLLGGRAVVVTMGGAANRIPRRWVDRLKAAGRVFSCMDSDAAGERAAENLTAALGDQHIPLTLPRGKDITEFVVDHGGDLVHWWGRALDLYEPKPVQLSLW